MYCRAFDYDSELGMPMRLCRGGSAHDRRSAQPEQAVHFAAIMQAGLIQRRISGYRAAELVGVVDARTIQPGCVISNQERTCVQLLAYQESCAMDLESTPYLVAQACRPLPDLARGEIRTQRRNQTHRLQACCLGTVYQRSRQPVPGTDERSISIFC